MRAFARSLLLAVFAAEASGVALAGTTGVYLPPAPGGPGGEDSIETASGTRCRQSINSSGPYLDVGVAGSAAKPLDSKFAGFVEERDQQGLAYARVTMPLGSRPKRIDCSQIYQMEIQRLQRELELLKMAAE